MKNTVHFQFIMSRQEYEILTLLAKKYAGNKRDLLRALIHAAYRDELLKTKGETGDPAKVTNVQL